VSERLASLGLWSVRGFGVARLRQLQALAPLESLLHLPCKEWLGLLDLPPSVAQAFEAHTLREMGERLLERAKRAHMQLLFYGEAGFPAGLEVLSDRPPVLFAWGVEGVAYNSPLTPPPISPTPQEGRPLAPASGVTPFEGGSIGREASTEGGLTCPSPSPGPKKIAMVGTRYPIPSFLATAAHFARRLAQGGPWWFQGRPRG